MNEEKHYDVEAVKQRLIDLRDLRREIENQSERLERLETKLVGVGAQALTDMPKSPSPSNDRISDLMQQKFDLEEDIRATLEHRRRERMFFEKIIRRLKHSDERAVIRSRYLDGQAGAMWWICCTGTRRICWNGRICTASGCSNSTAELY